MEYTAYLPELETIAREEQAILTGNPDNALAVAVRATAKIVNSNPLAYLRYGCYWFSVKAILNANLENGYGEITDDSVTAVYKGATDLQTLIAAQSFMEFYNANNFQGARVFALALDSDNLPVEWQLFDEDME